MVLNDSWAGVNQLSVGNHTELFNLQKSISISCDLRNNLRKILFSSLATQD